MLVLLCGCNPKDDSENTFEIIWACSGQEGTALHRAALEFKKAVEEKTNGQVKIELAWGGVYGGDREMVDSQMRGDIQMVYTSDIGYGTCIPEIGFVNLPYLFSDHDTVDEYYYNGFIGEKIKELLLNKGLRVLGWGENEFRALTANKPIATLNDLKGLKIRVPEFPSLLAFFQDLGANPTPMAFTEVLTALQQSTIDGQDNGPTLTVTQKFYEVQDYFIWTNHVYSGCAITINEDYFKTLPEDIQQILMEEGERCGELAIKWNREDIDGYVKVMEDYGLTIMDLSEELKEEFKKASKKVWEQFADEYDDDVMEKIFQELGD